jgi:hypothetical protein
LIDLNIGDGHVEGVLRQYKGMMVVEEPRVRSDRELVEFAERVIKVWDEKMKK